MNNQPHTARPALTLNVRTIHNRGTLTPTKAGRTWRAVTADWHGYASDVSDRLPPVYISDDGTVEIHGHSLPTNVFRHWVDALNVNLFASQPTLAVDRDRIYLDITAQQDEPGDYGYGRGSLVKASYGRPTDEHPVSLPSAYVNDGVVEFGRDYTVPGIVFRAWLDELTLQTGPDAPPVDDDNTETVWTRADLESRHPDQIEHAEEAQVLAYLESRTFSHWESGVAPKPDMETEHWNRTIERLRSQGHTIEELTTPQQNPADPEKAYRLHPPADAPSWRLPDEASEALHAGEAFDYAGSPAAAGQEVTGAEQPEPADRLQRARTSAHEPHRADQHHEADRTQHTITDPVPVVDQADQADEVDEVESAGQLARAWQAEQEGDLAQVGQLARAWQAEQAAVNQAGEAIDTVDSATPPSDAATQTRTSIEPQTPTVQARSGGVDQTTTSTPSEAASEADAPAVSAADPPPDLSTHKTTHEGSYETTHETTGSESELDAPVAHTDDARAQLYADAEAAISRAQQAVAELRRQEADAACRKADQQAQAERDRDHARAHAEPTARAAEDHHSNADEPASNELAAVLDRTDAR